MVECFRSYPLDQGADLHVARLKPLPLTVSCCSKIQIGFTFLILADSGKPEEGAFKWVLLSLLYFSMYVCHVCRYKLWMIVCFLLAVVDNVEHRCRCNQVSLCRAIVGRRAQVSAVGRIQSPAVLSDDAASSRPVRMSHMLQSTRESDGRIAGQTTVREVSETQLEQRAT